MAAKAWRITKARRCSCRLCCQRKWRSITPVEQKKKFIRARLDKVVTPSPARIAAKCPHFGVCGGCDYQHIPYEPQLEFKKEILRETLRRIGRVDWPGRNHDARFAAVGLPQPRAVESAAAGGGERRRRRIGTDRTERAKLRHRIFQGEHDRVVRGGNLRDRFAAAAENTCWPCAARWRRENCREDCAKSKRS